MEEMLIGTVSRWRCTTAEGAHQWQATGEAENASLVLGKDHNAVAELD
jgi:hypothetical protein